MKYITKKCESLLPYRPEFADNAIIYMYFMNLTMIETSEMYVHSPSGTMK